VPDLAGIAAPQVVLEGLTHVGTFDPRAKGSWSLEGRGLSVSQHPEDWAGIARLTGETWAFPDAGHPLLDYHELTAEQRGAISAFGIDRGYVNEVPAWEISAWDDEWEQERISVFLDEDDAAEEADEQGGEVREIRTLVATSTFPDSTVKPGSSDVEQILATVWVEEQAPGLHGVWWQDDYDPDRLSAPRGVIAASKIGDWIASATPAEVD
tara:strand:- start:12767 stop:13399 length:633 start_codon:yes stop_codon:yes gene_type:complete